LQDPPENDSAKAALQLSRLDRKLSSIAMDLSAESVVETAACYLKDRILASGNVGKNLFAIGEHAKLVAEMELNLLLERIYPAMEKLAIETGNVTEINETFLNTVDTMFVSGPVRAGLGFSNLAPPAKCSGLGLTFDRLIYRTSKGVGRGPFFELIRSSVIQNFEVIESAFRARPFDDDEVLVAWEKQSYVLTSRCLYLFTPNAMSILLDDIGGYSRKRRLFAWPILTFRVIVDLKSGERIIASGLGGAPDEPAMQARLENRDA
jgi:hypothetical protein